MIKWYGKLERKMYMSSRTIRYRTEFVGYIPNELETGVLYISAKNNTVMHLCACGCGAEIVTPLDRNRGWVLTYDGEHASLSPSIGNGRYKCRSHYCLKNGRVEWLPNVEEYCVEKVQSKKSWITKLISFTKRKK